MCRQWDITVAKTMLVLCGNKDIILKYVPI